MGKTNTSLARVEKYSAVDEALDLIYLYIQETYSSEEVDLICDELKSIARREDFRRIESGVSNRTYTQVQETLSKINEKQSIRKSKGVYYTPNDVVRFILTNSIKAAFGKLTASNVSDMNLDNIPYRSFCCGKTVFDPTCGAGEYLLAALDIKIDLLKKNTKISKRLIQEVVSTIYGNDVNVESIIITELRLLLFIIESCGVDYCTGLGNIMNAKGNYDSIADEIYHLREIKQNALVDNAEREGMKQRISEMQQFLSEQTQEITEYDEQLVRRLIEKITVFEEKVTVEFKSGTSVDVRR